MRCDYVYPPEAIQCVRTAARPTRRCQKHQGSEDNRGLKRQFADIRWLDRDTEAVAKGSAIAILSQSGNDILLTFMLGVVRFSRDRDREAVAGALEAAARMVREEIA